MSFAQTIEFDKAGRFFASEEGCVARFFTNLGGVSSQCIHRRWESNQ